MRIDYAIAAMQIADLSDSEIKAAGEKIHSELKGDYPYVVEKTMNDISVSVDSNGQASTKVTMLPTYHRVNDDRTDTISIAKNQIAFHSVNFTNLDDFVGRTHKVFLRTAEALGVNKFGRVSIRFITNFSVNESKSGFDGFNAEYYLAPAISVSPTKGPSHFEHRARTADGSIESRILVSVLLGGFIFPEELMDVAVDTFNTSRDRFNDFVARIDIDSSWNRERKLFQVEADSLLEKIQLVGAIASNTYQEIQGG